ncbi:hypothetical protein ERC79_09440 [Rhodococcus sp. ABRD24]|uniref:hypothetical protein n=1 Tax=Rhodococcus sp. ABRD24 TaxID=2507582 RepID=UPI00103E8E2B|nr:hypothetical protein [Rhodococcus sp. ABRD24]QBJ96172.1 hypothetical protein ERC79_09440 [Rhodococcus sp. ABRD24]
MSKEVADRPCSRIASKSPALETARRYRDVVLTRTPHGEERNSMITNALNWILGLIGSGSAGSSGYSIPPGSLGGS